MKQSTWKYTLREILIVIVGISIAFSMNKCSDNLKDNKLKTVYLTNLKSDAAADKLVLAKNIGEIDKKIETCYNLIPQLNTGKPQSMALLGEIFVILKYETFSPKDITYQTLVNSGDFKLIPDFELKAAIQSHYSNYKDMIDAYARHRSLIQDYLGNYLVNDADYDQLNEGKALFLDEIKLKNIMRAMSTTLEDKKKAAQNGIVSCDQLIAELEKALN
ncbi:MAG: DUF6090 family protein [Psychroserpens sp.]|uniref:DUF6090 family protein n=1 Tax=Psychroserpens sp. TaxID=2020870 RepID=UPI003C855D0A